MWIDLETSTAVDKFKNNLNDFWRDSKFKYDHTQGPKSVLSNESENIKFQSTYKVTSILR